MNTRSVQSERCEKHCVLCLFVCFHKRRQCGRVVRALDLKSRPPGFKTAIWSCFTADLDLTPQPHLQIANWSASCQLGFLTCYMYVSLKYLFLKIKCSTPLAPCYNHLPRVNKGHLFILFLAKYFLYSAKSESIDQSVSHSVSVSHLSFSQLSSHSVSQSVSQSISQ